jgi:NitT/TauT family transport system substrate-binding protein
LRAPEAPREKLVIATPTVPHAALAFLAEAHGDFAREGLDVVRVPAIHGKAAMDAMLQGKADIAMASDVVFVLEAMNRTPIAVAGSLSTSSRDLAVLVRRDRGIDSPRGLAGKRIGVTKGTASEYFLWAFFTSQKMGLDNADLVDLPPSELAGALASGAVDAVATWEPYVGIVAAAMSGEPGARVFYGGEAYIESMNLIGKADTLNARRVAVERLLRALISAEAFARSNPAEAQALAARGLGMDPATFESVWRSFEYRVQITQSQLIGLEEEATWAMESGYRPKGPMPDFLPGLYIDGLLAADPARVTIVNPGLRK